MKFECPSLATLYDRRYKFFANQRGRKSRSIVKKCERDRFWFFFRTFDGLNRRGKYQRGKKKTRVIAVTPDGSQPRETRQGCSSFSPRGRGANAISVRTGKIKTLLADLIVSLRLFDADWTEREGQGQEEGWNIATELDWIFIYSWWHVLSTQWRTRVYTLKSPLKSLRTNSVFVEIEQKLK